MRRTFLTTLVVVLVAVAQAIAPAATVAHDYYSGYTCFVSQGLYYARHYHANPRPPALHDWHDTHYHWVGYC
jgi:hypothetical protein